MMKHFASVCAAAITLLGVVYVRAGTVDRLARPNPKSPAPRSSPQIKRLLCLRVIVPPDRIF
jgi:hypothetical protein